MNEFVSSETHNYRFKMGQRIASALSGFIAGAIAASIIWLAVAYFTNFFR